MASGPFHSAGAFGAHASGQSIGVGPASPLLDDELEDEEELVDEEEDVDPPLDDAELLEELDALDDDALPVPGSSLKRGGSSPVHATATAHATTSPPITKR